MEPIIITVNHIITLAEPVMDMFAQMLGRQNKWPVPQEVRTDAKVVRTPIKTREKKASPRFPEHMSDTSIYTKVDWTGYTGLKVDILKAAIRDTKPSVLEDSASHHTYILRKDVQAVVDRMQEFVYEKLFVFE